MDALHPLPPREGVQNIHEPRKLTSGASWWAEWPTSKLLANQNRLRASCFVCQANQLCLHVQQSDIQWQIFGLYISQNLFSKNLYMINKFLMINKQFVLKILLLLRFRLLIFFFSIQIPNLVHNYFSFIKIDTFFIISKVRYVQIYLD